ncbi:hypothetical protein [Ramlibacter albus]|uniref:hypothetical protein n=1 Tax=Ramlibacter albus TaxID=2079448 RepID=UPI003F4996F1
MQSWSWNETDGWTEAGSGNGLPTQCGFGFKGQIAALADEVAQIAGAGFASWNDVRAQNESVEFLMPDDWNALERELKVRGYEVLWSRAGRPLQIGK